MEKETDPVYNLEWCVLFALLTFVMCIPAACTNRIFNGKITDINKNVITLDSTYKFKIYDTAGLYKGKQVIFYPTADRSKTNSRRVDK